MLDFFFHRRNTIRQPDGKAINRRKMGGELGKKEKTLTRNGGVEDTD